MARDPNRRREENAPTVNGWLVHLVCSVYFVERTDRTKQSNQPVLALALQGQKSSWRTPVLQSIFHQLSSILLTVQKQMIKTKFHCAAPQKLIGAVQTQAPNGLSLSKTPASI